MKHFLISLALALSLTLTAYGQTDSVPNSTPMQTAATATGNGNIVYPTRWQGVTLQVVISATATITVESTLDGTNWVATMADNQATDARATTITASGIYRVSTGSATKLRARISSYSSGTVTVTGCPFYSTVGKASGGGASNGQVFNEVSAPSTPSANTLIVYAKDSGGVSSLYFKKDDGTEIDLAAAGGTGLTSLNEQTGDTQTFTNDTNVTIVSGTNAHVLTWAGTLAASRGGTGLSALGTGVATWLGTPSSANLLAALPDETGQGAAVFGTSPAFTTSVTTGSTTFALLNTTATTVNAFGATTALNLGASATMILNFGGSTTASEFRFLEPSGSGTNYSAFKTVAQGADITYSLPPTVGAAGTVLTDVAGNGVLTWVAAGGGSSLPVADTQTIVSGSSDATKLLRFEVDGFTTGTTRVLTPPNADGTIAILGLAQTWTVLQTTQVTDASNTTITDLVTFAHRGSDAPDVGFGAGILLKGNDANAGSVEDMARVAAVWSDGSAGSEDSDVTFQLRTAGAALAEKWRFSGLGKLTIAGAPIILASATNAGITLTTNGTGETRVVNSTTAQKFAVYNTYASDSNYNRLLIDAGSNYAALMLTGAGVTAISGSVLYISNSNTSGTIQFQTDATNRWSFDGGGNLLANGADNTYTIGSSSSNRPSLVHVGTSVNVPHLVGTGTAPAIAAGAGAGTLPTVAISGSDLGGFISITTGTVPTGTNATIATITFNAAFAAAPKAILLYPANALTATLSGVAMVFIDQSSTSTTTFIIVSGTTALTGSSAYKWSYVVIQ